MSGKPCATHVDFIASESKQEYCPGLIPSAMLGPAFSASVPSPRGPKVGMAKRRDGDSWLRSLEHYKKSRYIKAHVRQKMPLISQICQVYLGSSSFFIACLKSGQQIYLGSGQSSWLPSPFIQGKPWYSVWIWWISEPDLGGTTAE